MWAVSRPGAVKLPSDRPKLMNPGAHLLCPFGCLGSLVAVSQLHRDPALQKGSDRPGVDGFMRQPPCSRSALPDSAPMQDPSSPPLNHRPPQSNRPMCYHGERRFLFGRSLSPATGDPLAGDR